MKKRIIICVLLIVAMLISYMPLKTLYIEILSKIHTTEETHQRAVDFIDKITDEVKEFGYDVEIDESSCGSYLCLDSYSFKSDEFEFWVEIINEKEIESFSVSFNICKYDLDEIDKDSILYVFNYISACNISKSRLTKALNDIEKINECDEEGEIYERNLLFMSDLCKISCYINSENEKIICLSGVPKFFA